MTVGETIKLERVNAGLTQVKLAEKCGMKDSAIRKYESGRIKPKMEMRSRIANAIGIDLRKLTLDVED